ncbi:hypothetical protein GCM10023107_93220 [Actinoplanes octamycinicus]
MAERPAAAKKNPGISLDVINSLPAELRNDPTLVVDSSYEIGTPIVRPDGTPVPGQSRAAMAAAAACGRRGGTVVAVGTGRWSGVSKSGCSILGRPGWVVGYSWARAQNVRSTGCVQGLGFNARGQATWQAIGICGTSGRRGVPWGNVLATPKVRARTAVIPLGFVATWRH